MNQQDPQHWSPFEPFDPQVGTVVYESPGSGRGYWVGAPGVMYDPTDQAFYLTTRIRRPRGVEPDRGAEVHLARSEDGIHFRPIWKGMKDELNTASIERSAIRRLGPNHWVLYTSYVDPKDQRWRTDLIEADAPEHFDLRNAQSIFKAGDVGAEGVKDPFVFQVGGLYHMILSYATTASDASSDDLHGTADAYNTGLIRSATALATSSDGLEWEWEGEILGPSREGWDRYCARIGCIWRIDNTWIALYDGSASVSENYEERVGVAISFDLRTFHRVSRSGPIMTTPAIHGAMRYFDVLDLPEATFFYYEQARPDGSHELRVFRRKK